MNDLDPPDLEKLSDLIQEILSELDSTEDIKLPWNIAEDLDQAYSLLRSVDIKLRRLIA